MENKVNGLTKCVVWFRYGCLLFAKGVELLIDKEVKIVIICVLYVCVNVKIRVTQSPAKGLLKSLSSDRFDS